MEDKNRFVDQLLDSALARRQKAEPRPGLEARILEGVRAADGKRAQSGKSWKSRRTGWALVVAAATVAVVSTGVYLTYRRPVPAVQTPQASHAVTVQPQRKELAANPKANPRQNQAAPVLEAKRTARKTKSQPRKVEAHHWPSQFPSPAPLSREEKALIRYVQETPPEVLATPLFKEQATLRPIEIKPLIIKPLEIKPLSLGAAHEEIQ